jgi:small-conductance mechanosensitive channel
VENVQDWTKALTASVMQVAETFFAFLPSVLGSLTLVVLGWLLARILRGVTRRVVTHVLERLARQRVARTSAIDSRIQQSQTYQSAPAVVGAIVYFMVLIFFFAAAIEALGLPTISNVLSLVTAYLPRVLAAAMIVFIGLWAGDFVNTLMQRTSGLKNLDYAPLAGRAMQVLIGIVFLIIAVGQLGIDSTVLIITLAIIFASTFGAAALAFGLGARTTVGNIIAARYVKRGYRLGDTVRIGDLEGQVTEITDTAVMLDSTDGRLMVPAERFSEVASLLVRRVV